MPLSGSPSGLCPYQLPAEDPAGLHAPHGVGISQLQEFLAQLPGDNDLAKDIHACICGDKGSTGSKESGTLEKWSLRAGCEGMRLRKSSWEDKLLLQWRAQRNVSL